MVIAIIGILAAVVLTAVNSVRKQATAAAIKMEARQLMTLAQMHYLETGNFTSSTPGDGIRFAGRGWLKNDSDTTGGSAVRCSEGFDSGSAYYDEAVVLCNNITSKLSTNMSGDLANNKLLIGCAHTCTDQKNKFSVKVKLQDNRFRAGNSAGDYFCVGTSGAVYEGLYNIDAQGCYHSP